MGKRNPAAPPPEPRIYVHFNKDTGEKRLVRATDQLSVFQHCHANVEVRTAKTTEVEDVLTAGGKIEHPAPKVDKDQKPLPLSDAGQNAAGTAQGSPPPDADNAAGETPKAQDAGAQAAGDGKQKAGDRKRQGG